MNWIALILLLPAIAAETNSDEVEYVEIYSTCDATPNSEIHKDNGLYYIKPFEDGPIIPAICSNGYTMIDPSLDLSLQSISSYLSSWDYSRTSLDFITTNFDDTSTFRQWWLPSNSKTKFRVANKCQSCQSSSDPKLNDNVAYYTDSSLFCYTYFMDGNPCSQNINEYACNKCDTGTFEKDTESTYWSKCFALQTSSDTPSLHGPQMRVNHHLIYRPVMSMTRQTCTCYQSFPAAKPIKYLANKRELPHVTIAKQIGSNDIRHAMDYIDPLIRFEKQTQGTDTIDCDNNVHYLSQSDFVSGTYRIRECGEYIFTQDIECNFNAPSKAEEESPDFSPNSITGDRLYWYPTKEQALTQYPGLYTYEGTYSLGFFAGITIECDDVIINLNGYAFSMDRRFYLQQRFFSLIELASKPFLPIQGASTWGLTDVFYASNVEIRGPGHIGLSSHHGIHGNMVNNAYIHDLSIHNFDVAGIACNGCRFVRMENLSVGPQNNDIPTLGRFTHSRAFIPRLMDLNEKYGHEEIQFYGRKASTISSLCARMVQQMDMIYNNYINGVEYAADDREWIAAQKIFKNDNGWMDGGSSYGVVINGGGAAVVGIGTRVQGTNNIFMDNVEIFGIYNAAVEKIKFSLPDEGTSRGILFDVTDWIAVSDQIADRSKTQYIGDVFTDIQFAANEYVTSWYYRNSQYIAPQEVEYVFNGNLKENGYPFLTIFPENTQENGISGCGTDIQLHSSKGAIGLMVNGAQDSEFDNIHIHDVYNWADLGLDVCGEYEGPHLTTEDIDIQYGYTGTRSHGMVIDWTSGNYKNIIIENVESYNGEANGLTIYKESFVNLQNILVTNINAGTKLSQQIVDQLVLPNLIPRACAVDIHYEDTVINYIDGDDIDNIVFDNIIGFDVCQQFDEKHSNKFHSYHSNNTNNNNINISSISVIFLIFVILMICVIFYVLYRSVKCVNYKGWRKQNREIICEQTPLLPSI